MSTDTADMVLTGELDATNCGHIPAAVANLCEANLCEQGRRTIRIDLGAVTFIDAATIGAFLRSRQCARAFGCDVVFVSAHGLPRQLLRMFELDAELSDGRPSHG